MGKGENKRMKLPNDQIIHYESKDGISIDITRTELVRCPECKYFIKVNESCGKCTYRTRPFLYMENNDYCSYGERKGRANGE